MTSTPGPTRGLPSVAVDSVPDPLPEDIVVLDVREPVEWEHGHVPGALHVPLGDLPARRSDLPAEGQVLVVCRVGGRSAQAVMWLGQQGHDVVNLQGGMLEWEAAGRPLVSETDRDPRIV